ncbi:MAG: DUF4411 family protein [Deltaproteobacteria bacterium]|nr:DUF4411 family protein [Deltaproteobacteria bacterium]
MAAYLLDANVLIEAWNHYYRPEFLPGFWTWVDEQQQARTLRTTQSVHAELSGDGPLSDWILARGKGWVVREDDEATQETFARIVGFVNSDPRWSPRARADFLRGADPWVIAVAAVQGMTIVTLERNDPTTRKKVLIPVVAAEFGVATVNTFELLRRLGARLG